MTARRDGAAPVSDDADADRLKRLEAGLRRAQNGDRVAYRAELERLSRRADALLAGEDRPPGLDGKRNRFERVRDAAGAIHEELSFLGAVGALIGVTAFGVFAPFLLMFLIDALAGGG